MNLGDLIWITSYNVNLSITTIFPCFFIDSICNGHIFITIHELKPWVFFSFNMPTNQILVLQIRCICEWVNTMIWKTESWTVAYNFNYQINLHRIWLDINGITITTENLLVCKWYGWNLDMTLNIIFLDITKRRILQVEISNQTKYSNVSTMTEDNNESTALTEDFRKTNKLKSHHL